MRDVAEVVVCAPDREQSGTGTAVSLLGPVRLTEAVSPVEGVKGWSVQGTPCDAVIVALETFLRDQVDLVVAGINAGANLGEDILISGTVGAALQGYFRGIPSVAISVTSLTDLHLEPAAKVAKLLVQHLAEDALFRPAPGGRAPRKPLLLNINVPNLPLDKLQGIEVTRLGHRVYADTVQEGHDGRRKWYWVVRDKPAWRVVKGTDIWAIRHQRVSITPLHTDLTRGVFLRRLASLQKEICAALGLGTVGSEV